MYNIRRVYVYIYTLIYTHTYTNPWKGFKCSFSDLKAMLYFKLHSTPLWPPSCYTFATLTLNVVRIMTYNYTVILYKANEIIQFNMPLKIIIVLVRKKKEANFGKFSKKNIFLLLTQCLAKNTFPKWKNNLIKDDTYRFSQR